jgi:hypothetical protein
MIVKKMGQRRNYTTLHDVDIQLNKICRSGAILDATIVLQNLPSKEHAA